MATTPTFDYFPRGTQLIATDEVKAAMTSVLEAGGSAGAAYDAMEEAQVRQLRSDPAFRETLREAYSEAGVNLVSATMGSLDRSIDFQEGVRQDLARWQARFDNVDWLRKVTTPSEARNVVADDDVGVVLNVQNGGAAIDGSLAETAHLCNAGVRIVQLTYNSQNLVGTGCTERVDSGLTYHGVDFIEELQDRRMIVDLSHCGRETTLDTLDIANDPVAFTHTFCEALADHDRAKSDEELKRLAEANGYVGILTVPFFLAPGESDPSFDLVFDHIDHAVDVVGIDRVGIGTDWGSWTPELPKELHDGLRSSFEAMGFRDEHGVTIGEGFGPMQEYKDWPAIKRGLSDRGYSETEISGILGENFLSYWDRVV